MDVSDEIADRTGVKFGLPDSAVDEDCLEDGGRGRIRPFGSRAVDQERVQQRRFLFGRARAFPQRAQRPLDVALVGQRLHVVGDEGDGALGVIPELGGLGAEVIERGVIDRLPARFGQKQQGKDQGDPDRGQKRPAADGGHAGIVLPDDPLSKDPGSPGSSPRRHSRVTGIL